MKTLEQIKAFKGGKSCNFIDARDRSRLSVFLRPEEWESIGLQPAEGADLSNYQVEPYTEENVLKHLASDLSFAFEKALNKRGISSGLMHDVIKMWMWVLDDPLQDDKDYAQYGLPLYRKVAIKYNLPNPIGDENGDESRYASGWD